jgi:hypothetical protein
MAFGSLFCHHVHRGQQRVAADRNEHLCPGPDYALKLDLALNLNLACLGKSFRGLQVSQATSHMHAQHDNARDAKHSMSGG